MPRSILCTWALVLAHGLALAQLPAPQTAADSAIVELFAQPDPARVAALIEQLDDPSPDVRDDAADALVRLGDGGLPQLEEALAGDTLSPEARFQVESVLEELRTYVPHALKKELSLMLGLDATMFDGYELLAVEDKLSLIEMLQTYGLTRAAGFLYRHFRLESNLRLRIAYARALRVLGARIVLGELADALRAVEPPENPLDWIWLASRFELIELEVAQGRRDEALAMTDAMLAQLDGAAEFAVDENLKVSLLLMRSQLLAEGGRVDEALEPLDRLAELYPNEPRFDLEAGQLLLAQGRTEEATARFRAARAIYLDSTDERGFRFEGLKFLVGVFLQMGLPDEALVTIDAIDGLLVYDIDARVLRARLHAAIGEPEEALRIALAVFPQTGEGSALHAELTGLIPELLRAQGLGHLADPEFVASLFDGPSLESRMYAARELVTRRLDALAWLAVERLLLIAPRVPLVYEWALQLHLSHADLEAADAILARAEKHLGGRTVRALTQQVDAARNTLESEGGRTTEFFGRWVSHRGQPGLPVFGERSVWPRPVVAGGSVVVADTALVGLCAFDTATGRGDWTWEPVIPEDFVPSSPDEVLGLAHGGLVASGGELWVGSAVYSYEPRRPQHSNKCLGMVFTRLRKGLEQEAVIVREAPVWTGDAILLEGRLLVYISRLKTFRQLVCVDLESGRLRFAHRFRADAVYGPFASDGRISLVTQLGLLVVFDLDGTELLRVKSGSAQGAVAAGQRMAIFHREKVEVFDLASGERLWETPIAEYLVGEPAIVGERLVANLKDEGLLGWELADGREVFRRALPNTGARDIYALGQDRVVVVNARPEASGLGAVVRLLDADGNVLWRDAVEQEARLVVGADGLFFHAVRRRGQSWFVVQGLVPNDATALTDAELLERLLASARNVEDRHARIILYTLALKHCSDHGPSIYLDLVETLLAIGERARARFWLDEGRLAYPQDESLRSKDKQLDEQAVRRSQEK